MGGVRMVGYVDQSVEEYAPLLWYSPRETGALLHCTPEQSGTDIGAHRIGGYSPPRTPCCYYIERSNRNAESSPLSHPPGLTAILTDVTEPRLSPAGWLVVRNIPRALAGLVLPYGRESKRERGSRAKERWSLGRCLVDVKWNAPEGHSDGSTGKSRILFDVVVNCLRIAYAMFPNENCWNLKGIIMLSARRSYMMHLMKRGSGGVLT